MKRETVNHHRFWWGLIIILALGLLCLIGYEYQHWQSAANEMHTRSSATSTALIDKHQPFSVLVMGTDVGALGRGTSYAGNTDTMEVITVNPRQKRITMVAIPRDTLVKVQTKAGTRYVKINAAYAIGGPRLAMHQVSKLVGVPINFYALTNMGTLKTVVNAVGGVNVNNPFAFTYEGHHFKKGWQHLNGKDALKYSRMRYDDPNNDYGRQKRQQQIMTSVIHKFKHSGSISAANKIMAAVKDGVRTDLPIDSVSVLYGNYRRSMNHVKTYHFHGKDATIEGTSFQIASPKEINRVSKLIRTQLGLKPITVTNNETKMYKMQRSYDGYNNTNFVLPGQAEYNVPGSGRKSSSTSTTRSTGTTTTYSNSYGSYSRNTSAAY